MLLQSDLDKLFDDIERCIMCPNDTVNYVRNLKPTYHEIETLGWRYRMLGFLDGMVASQKMTIQHYTNFFGVLFGEYSNQTSRGRTNNTAFALRINTENGKHDFDVMATNEVDAYYQLSKRMEFICITNITSIEVYKGLSKHIGENTNPMITEYSKDRLFTQEIAIANTVIQ